MSGFTTEEGKAEAGYRGAEIQNEEQNYLEAVELCSRIEKEYAHSEGASLAKSLHLKIKLPYLYLQTQNMLPTKLHSVNLYARNITTLFTITVETNNQGVLPVLLKDKFAVIHRKVAFLSRIGSNTAGASWTTKVAKICWFNSEDKRLGFYVNFSQVHFYHGKYRIGKFIYCDP